MKALSFTDCNEIADSILIDSFYPSPSESQDVNRKLFESILKKNINPFNFRGLLDTTLNRYFLTDIKVLEHPLILQNIIKYCKNENCKDITLKVHTKNKNLGSFYKASLEKENFTVHITYHEKSNYWKNSLTKTSGTTAKKIKINFVLLGQFFLLFINFLFNRAKKWQNKKLVIWSSFANNREQIDYPFLDSLEQKDDIIVIHPNPYIYKSKQNWDKSIYWLGPYSINPFTFLSSCLKLTSFKEKFNKELKDFEDILKYIPAEWNIDVIQKTKFFFVYNLLMNGLIDKLYKDKSVTVTNVFRGGAAAGLIYSGIAKTKYDASQVTNILVPHGTEFNPIDHFSYFYLDYNILPSESINKNWNDILNNEYSSLSPYNFCQNIAGGRIDYSYLQKKVNKSTSLEKEPDTVRIGIVLTYNSNLYQQEFISKIIKLFSAKTGFNTEYVIKPRPNLPFEPNQEMLDKYNIKIHTGDIYSFLNYIDVILGTVSVYGVLTMVVTDAILCDIPAIYFFPDKNLSLNALGYSYHPCMESFCFAEEHDLKTFLQSQNSKAELISSIKELNENTKEMLVFKGDPDQFLEEVITNSLRTSSSISSKSDSPVL